jgi:hypothetical protein
MGRVFFASALAALVQFLWGALFWVGLPISNLAYTESPNPERLTELLRSELPSSGTYLLPPNELRDRDFAAWSRWHERGPRATLFYRAEGAASTPASEFALGYVQMLAGILVVALLLHFFAAGVEPYWGRVAFVAGVFLAAAILVDLAAPIWAHLDWRYWLVDGAFQVTSGCWVGMVLARMIPEPET